MDDEGLTMEALSKAADVPYDHIRQYLKKYEYKKGMNQWEVLQVGKVLGIHIGLDIQLVPK
jgi:hypothetical protein